MGSIRLLGISGSPRKGATAFVVGQALEFAESLGDVETEFISLRGKKINFCLHCDYCVRTKEGCIQKDDVSDLYPSMEAADAWLLATPVYQGSVSGQLKAVLDRCRAVVARNPDALQNKVGAAIAVGGDRIGGQEPAIMAIHAFYLANKMIPVSGGPFGANLGGTVWSRDKRAEGAAADEVGMRSVQRTVKRLIEVAKWRESLRNRVHREREGTTD
jgi:multimeric flavodoxin WrbA